MFREKYIKFDEDPYLRVGKGTCTDYSKFRCLWILIRFCVWVDALLNI